MGRTENTDQTIFLNTHWKARNVKIETCFCSFDFPNTYFLLKYTSDFFTFYTLANKTKNFDSCKNKAAFLMIIFGKGSYVRNYQHEGYRTFTDVKDDSKKSDEIEHKCTKLQSNNGRWRHSLISQNKSQRLHNNPSLIRNRIINNKILHR